MIEDEMMNARNIPLDELGQTFVVRLVMRLKHKDGHKTYFAFGRTFLRNTSRTMHYERYFVWTHNASCARLYTKDA